MPQNILQDRRTVTALVAIILLFVLGLVKDLDVVYAIAAISGALSGFNAFEKTKTRGTK
jgi:hypothetical protein